MTIAPADAVPPPSVSGLLSQVAPYPLTFLPIYQPRVWGGRNLSRLLARALPEGAIGESWELVDRPEAVSQVADGPLAGVSLHELWVGRPDFFDRPEYPRDERFPLLVKFLDCQDRLSVQVHPGPQAAALLGGECKTELWYFLEASPLARVQAGLKAGVTQAQLEAALQEGGSSLLSLLHTLTPATGQSLLIPPGRVHAVGGGAVICEVQQSSDTTYRLYDWDRLDGAQRPRPLHHREALASIQFLQPEAHLEPADEPLRVELPCFQVSTQRLEASTRVGQSDSFTILVVLEGAVCLEGKVLPRGMTCLLPAPLGAVEARPQTPTARILLLTH